MEETTHSNDDINNDNQQSQPTSGMTHTRRVQRSDAGQLRVGQRDLEGLRWCSEQGAMRLDQLATLFARTDLRPVSLGAARKTVHRWVNAGWAESRTILHGQPAYVWLTTAGTRQAGLGYPAGPPALATLNHQTEVNHLRLEIGLSHPEARWRPERALRALLPARRAGTSVPHLPDAELTLPDRRTYALELERTPKTVTRTRGIIQGLLARKNDYDFDGPAPTGAPHRYTGVLYYVSEAAAPVVREAVSQLDTPSQQRVHLQVRP